eukprot:Hpha_TRINITY_DN29836_c0_g1::TRINITY_DN29836_c0_g1_i1::g.2980::m.2980
MWRTGSRGGNMEPGAGIGRGGKVIGFAMLVGCVLLAGLRAAAAAEPGSMPSPQGLSPPVTSRAAESMAVTPAPPPALNSLRRLRVKDSGRAAGALVGITDDVLVVGDTPGRPRIPDLVLTEEGHILNPTSGMKVGPGKPIGVGDPPELVLTEGDKLLRWELLPSGELRVKGGDPTLEGRVVGVWQAAYSNPTPPEKGVSLVLLPRPYHPLRFEFVEAPYEVPAPPPRSEERPKVVVGTYIHVRGEMGRETDQLLDAAAVLTHRVWLLQQNPERRFDYSLLVVLSNTSAALRQPLQRLGWRVVIKRLSVDYSDVRNSRIAKELHTDGTIGLWEIIKLEFWRPSVTGSGLHAVLVCDLDIHFRTLNIEEVFSPPWFRADASLGFTQGAWPIERLNGGFLLVRPDERTEQDYHNILEILREGDFRGGSGWKGAG